jgi:peptide chain release factor 2
MRSQFRSFLNNGVNDQVFDEIVKASAQQRARFEKLSAPLNLVGKRNEIAELEASAGDSNFWDDPAFAQKQMQRLNAYKEAVAPWTDVSKRIEDVAALVELAQFEDDPEQYTGEIEREVKAVAATLDKLEIEMLLSAPHDSAPALLELNAGAGGDEANDWAQMLLRMYLRWADRNGYKAEIIDEVEGEVAGIKSSTLRIEGKHAYGLLQAEHGVHRLVRLSPFNANNKRQTSFA